MPSYTTRRISDPKEQAALEVEASHLGTNEGGNAKIATLRSLVPFDFYALSGIDYPGLGVGGGVMLASDMPEGFLRDFLAQGLYSVDPMSYRVTKESVWYGWHDLTPGEINRKELEPIRRLENAYGITTRACVGFFRRGYRYGGAIFCRDKPFSDSEKFVLEAGARMIHAELSAGRIASMSAHAGLNEGEVRCLKSAADGLTATAASRITGFTAETIGSYIKSATKKLGCENRTHAVAEALRRSILD